MRRSSRSVGMHNAELAGQEAGRRGLGADACPYRRRHNSSVGYREAWLRGWESERLVWLYRIEPTGDMSAVSVRRADVKYMTLGEWAATAERIGEEINVKVIHGDPERRQGQWRLTELVRGDMQG